jgi:recombination protein RecA
MPREKKTPGRVLSPVVELKTERVDRSRLNALASVAKQFKAWKPASEVLTKVRAHPTIFPGVDRATGVGGWPVQRVTLVHGPSNHGKTQFVHGLGLSFLQAGNFYAYVDAEYTTPSTWLASLMSGFEMNPAFVAQRPKSMEETVEGVREFATNISKARRDGDIPEDVCGLIVVDSIRKLVPQRLLDKILKGEGGTDGASGRGMMMKAALNAQWMDELVPLLYHSNLAMVIISRETEAQQEPGGIKLNEPGAGFDYKVGGGKGLVYESSIVARITRSWVKEGTGETARIVGERHKVSITKTKVSGKQDKVINGFFNTSNGAVSPEGFDLARDVFELALEMKVIEQTGAWFKWQDQKWQGESKAVLALSKDAALLGTLEGLVR